MLLPPLPHPHDDMAVAKVEAVFRARTKAEYIAAVEALDEPFRQERLRRFPAGEVILIKDE